MSEIKKPLATIELASAAISLIKTGAIVFAMMMLEWSRLREKKAKLEAAKAKNDLEIEKATGQKETTNAKAKVNKYLANFGLPPGSEKP